MKDKKIEEYLIDIYEKKMKDFSIDNSKKWAIYGTGNGGEIIFSILEKWGKSTIVDSFIDRDEVVDKISELHGVRVNTIYEACKNVDGIFIGSMDYHETIFERVKNYVNENCNHKIEIINLFGYNTDKEVREYVEYLESQKERKDPMYYKDYDESQFELTETDTKIIAWYLPQFHRIDVNDKFHGKGFTEWTNTSKAMPMFTGHYQPHIPYDVGYYSLNDGEVFSRQIELAKHYGIYGFSFYFYWFSGKRVMEKPLEYFLNHPELDIKFCITWANENWSSLWNGSSNDLILKQDLKLEDDSKLIHDMIPYMKDPRYISLDGKKLIIIYNATIWEKERVKRLLSNMREEAKKHEIGKLCIMLCNSFGFDQEVSEWGADGLVEFPPHGVGAMMPTIRIDGYTNPNFMGRIINTEKFINQKQYLCKHNSENYFRGVMPSWDNTSRKAYNGASIYRGLNPRTFETWLYDVMDESKKIHSSEEDIVFVNAWNEWAEGAHLEPDLKYGYANLSAVKSALISARKE